MSTDVVVGVQERCQALIGIFAKWTSEGLTLPQCVIDCKNYVKKVIVATKGSSFRSLQGFANLPPVVDKLHKLCLNTDKKSNKNKIKELKDSSFKSRCDIFNQSAAGFLDECEVSDSLKVGETKSGGGVIDIQNAAAKDFWKFADPNVRWADVFGAYKAKYPAAQDMSKLKDKLGGGAFMTREMFQTAVADYGFPFVYDSKAIDSFNASLATTKNIKKGNLAGNVAKLKNSVMGVDKDLTKAVYADQAETVGVLLKSDSGAVNKKTGPFSWTPMHVAGSTGNVPLLRMMISLAPVDFTVRDLEGRTAIDLAAQYDRLEAVKFLYPYYKSVNMTIAARSGTSNTIKWLTGQMTDIVKQLSQDYKGRNAVIEAASLGNRDVLEILLGIDGVDPNASDNKGRSAVHHVVKNGELDVLDALIKHEDFDPDVLDSNGMTALMEAVVSAPLETVGQLLMHGANPDVLGKKGETALFYLSLREVVEKGIVKALVDGGADANHKDDDGNTVGHYIALAEDSKTSAEVVSQLVEAGYDPDAKNNNDDTPMLIAAATGKAQTTQSLASHGANPSITNKAGDAPIHHAKTPEIVKTLIQAGASLNICNKKGETPPHTLAKANNAESLGVVLQAGALLSVDNNGDTALQAAVQRGNVNAIKSISTNLSTQFDPKGQFRDRAQFVNHANKQGVTAGHQSVAANLETVQAVIAGGVDMKAVDPEGNTVGHYAAARGDRAVMEQVIDEKDIGKQNKAGNTILHVAVASGNLAATAVCLEKGASTSVTNASGEAAATQGFESGHPETANLVANHEFKAVGASVGELKIGLRWGDYNDLDLHVITPTGKHISWQSRKHDGGELDIDANALSHRANPAQEHIFWKDAESVLPGKYLVYVCLTISRPKEGGLDPCPFQIFLFQGATIKFSLGGKVHGYVQKQLNGEPCDIEGLGEYPHKFVCSFEFGEQNTSISCLQLAPEIKDLIVEAKSKPKTTKGNGLGLANMLRVNEQLGEQLNQWEQLARDIEERAFDSAPLVTFHH